MRKLPFLYLFWFYSFLNIAQESATTFSFVNYSKNHLIFDKDSSAFLKFYVKMDSILAGKKEQLKIVHIGGSHVQGGTWSNTFSSSFQQTLNLSGGGYFVFPYKFAKTNGQPYANSFTAGNWKKCRCVLKDFCLPLGMNGISVSTNDSLTYFGVALTKYSQVKKVNTVKVYHNFNPSFDLYSLMRSERTDYPQLGYSSFTFDAPIDTLSFSLMRCDTVHPDFTLFGFSLENNASSGVYLAGLGVNGASSHSFLRCNYFVDQLKTIDPDMAIISLGVNDVQSKDFSKEQFKAHYDSLITLIRKASPECAIILTTTTDNFIRRKTPNTRTELSSEALFEVMRTNQVAVWDMYELMGGFKSIVKWGRAGLASKDRVHFSGKGYRILGNFMFEAVYKSYLNNTKNAVK